MVAQLTARAGLTGRAHCLIPGCGWAGPQEWRWVAESRAAWHVFEEHPQVWAAADGLGPVPRSPRPQGSVR